MRDDSGMPPSFDWYEDSPTCSSAC
jgi:hypothetical protein